MKLEIVNHQLRVGTITLLGVSSSSLLQVGDSGAINLYSYFDTPPESVIVGPLAPLPEPGEAGGTEPAEDEGGPPS